MLNTIKQANMARRAERKRLEDMVILSWYKAVMNGSVKLMNKRFIRFQYGNKKLAADDKIAFVIFSLPAVRTCPGATVECMKNCYARRDERFIGTRAGRVINEMISRREDFEQVLEDAIRRAVYTNKGERRKKFQGKEIVFRIHESGDFYSEKYMKAWFHVAARFPEITFFTYTKSFRIYEKCMNERPDNFEVRASVWSDTTVEEYNLILKCGMSIYTAYDADGVNKAIAGGAMKCTCESCTKCCCACARHENREIVTEIH